MVLRKLTDIPLDVVDAGLYSAATKSYPKVRVLNIVRSITVMADPEHDGAVAVITPSDQDSLIDDHQVVLRAAAKTDITVDVTAEDGTTTDTYSVTIYRGRRVPSDNADLSALSLSGVTMSPPFDPAKIEYIGSAANSTQLTTVSYTADVGAQSVEIQNGDETPVDIPDADAAPGHQVPLAKGKATVINVTVTAEDAPTNTEKTYKITVYRDAEASSDATLQTLTLSGITLTPGI